MEGYYASVQDAGKTGLLLGPFEQHEMALDVVPVATATAQQVNSRAVFYAFGTCKITAGELPEGVLNAIVKAG